MSTEDAKQGGAGMNTTHPLLKRFANPQFDAQKYLPYQKISNNVAT